MITYFYFAILLLLLVVQSNCYSIQNRIVVKIPGVNAEIRWCKIDAQAPASFCYRTRQLVKLNAANTDDDDNLLTFYSNSAKPTQQEVKEIVEDLEAAKPSTWAIMKDVSTFYS
jgi:hypothetical protein